MQFIKHTGWVVLSTLCFFLAMLVVQYITFELLDLTLIVNHVLLFALSALVGLAFAKWRGLIGAVVFSLILFTLMFSANNLTFEIYAACALIVTGAATGTLIRQKKRIAWILTLLTGSLVLLIAYQTYSTITVEHVAATQKTDVSRFNKMGSDFVSINGENFRISEDTVYLINFTFHACKPCRNKRPSLELLEKEFINKPFKLVTIHCVESEEVFRKYYSDYTNCYHNSNPKVEQMLGIPSYPYEIIFDKNGREVRRFSAFSLDAKDDYQAKTRKLIKKLLHEKY